MLNINLTQDAAYYLTDFNDQHQCPFKNLRVHSHYILLQKNDLRIGDHIFVEHPSRLITLYVDHNKLSFIDNVLCPTLPPLRLNLDTKEFIILYSPDGIVCA